MSAVTFGREGNEINFSRKRNLAERERAHPDFPVFVSFLATHIERATRHDYWKLDKVLRCMNFTADDPRGK